MLVWLDPLNVEEQSLIYSTIENCPEKVFDLSHDLKGLSSIHLNSLMYY